MSDPDASVSTLTPVQITFKCEADGLRVFVSSARIVTSEEFGRLPDASVVCGVIVDAVDRWREAVLAECDRFDSLEVAKALVKHIRPATEDIKPIEQYAFAGGGSLLPAKER